mgnify:CR=1 FL=1
MFKKLLIITLSSLSLFAMGGPSLVETTKLIKGEVNPLQEFVGTLKFDRNSVLAAQNAGVIKALNFEVGDKVKKGDVLVQVDADVLNAQVAAASANVASARNEKTNAKKDFERYSKLLLTKAISQKQYDDAQLKYNTTTSSLKALQAQLRELQIQRNKKSIKAPFDGVIVDKKIDLGEWVSAGTPVLSMVDITKVEITVNVPLTIVNGLKKGDQYDINVGNNILKATLQAAIPSGDKLTRTFPVKFKAKTNGTFLFDGQQAKVSLSQNAKKESLLLPRDAVIKRFGQNVVFAINKESMAQMIPVQVVGYVGKQVAVSAKSLQIGMDIVVKGNERVFPNSPVKIINK